MLTDRDTSYYIILKYWSALIRWRADVDFYDPNSIVVATNGCFDIVHAGHIHMLKGARALGDYLVVGLNGDESVRRLKGPSRPINDENNRKIVLDSIRYVDFTHIFNESRASTFLRVARPHIYVKSRDYSLNTMDQGERNVLKELGTKIVSSDMVPGLSTTKIINSL